MSADALQSLTDRADRLKAAGRLGDAIALYGQAVQAAPGSGVAEHNFAAALGDAARWPEAEAACRRAFAKGLDAPETWLVLARAALGQRRLDEAEAGFREALRRRPTMADAHRDLAQLIWMRTGEIAPATEALDAAIRSNPDDPVLGYVKAKALEYAGDLAGAYEALGPALARGDTVPVVVAADLASRIGKVDVAVSHAEAAAAGDPSNPVAQAMLAQTALAAGRPERAAAVLEALIPSRPFDQHLLALQGTAWRMLGDPRGRERFDYDTLVRPWRLRTPQGWSSLEAYLSDLAAGLKGEHAFLTHPFEQSVRHGSQSPDILRSGNPAIRAFPEALEPVIREHLNALGRGPDVVRRRNTGQVRFRGIWSVLLRPHGFHANHVHPDGWLSSACYVELPLAVQGSGREGWIQFGEPGVPTSPALQAEHFVRPEPGMVVLFPSYMWHGTVPFRGPEGRLTIAFDLIPAG